MRRDHGTPAGEVRRFTLDSRVLAGNRLGDPTRRELHLYLPPGHDGARPLPLLVDLVGFTGSGPSHTNWRAFTENLPERLDRLIAADAMPPVAVAFPDCYTRLGGNQYIDSDVVGRYEDYLIGEILPFLEQRLPVGGPGRRGVFGKSSGGFGAIMHGMRHPDTWSALACHSGDMAFELCYLHDLPTTLNELAKHERSIERFVNHFAGRDKPSEAEISTLMILAMAATYDPDPDPASFLGLRLPCDLETGELIEARWARWLAHDPARIVDRHADALRRLKAIWLDCGNVDQYHLHFGARRLHRALERLGIAHRYEEFADDHTNIDYRMDASLPFLARALAG
jgi:S-formylglutathione hydrolase FrmB